MQKLKERYNNTPTDAPQVRSNCDSVIKHDCVIGQVLQDIKTSFNNSDVDQRQHTDEPIVNVYVLNKNGKPLMPCKPTKARHLLEQNKAKVVSRKPFTIQLLWNCEHKTQSITLGVDPGYKNVGVSAVSDKKELLSAEITLRTDIPKKLQTRAMYRKIRRNRLWHRKPRFLNRARPKGWLAPSIQHKLDTHIRLVEKIKKLLPITKVIVEVASFDTQKIKNPNIKGKEYQQGEQLGFWNTREYVLHRDNHTCQHCKGKKKDTILQVHHINGKSEGATNRPEELLTVCKTCHTDHHSGKDIIPKKKIKNFKPETFMSTIRWKIVNLLNCKHTYGYITKHNRIEQGLPKSHINDAFIIAGGIKGIRRRFLFVSKQIRRNNRCMQLNRKGFCRSIRRRHYSLQPNDTIQFKEKICKVKGVHGYGSYVRLLDNVGNIIDSNIKNVRLICYGKGILV